MLDTLPVIAVIALSVAGASGDDPDTDGDGLSDFQEAHKYFTDPQTADSDADGNPDGDWNERREYAYTIRTVLRVMPPISEDALGNDYQDGLVIASGKDDRYVDLEIVHYPFNSVSDGLRGDRGWFEREPAPPPPLPLEMREFLAPGVTTNWTPAMRDDLLASLRDKGIPIEQLTDEDAAKHVAGFLLTRDMDTINSSAYGIQFKGGLPGLVPGSEEAFRSIMVVQGGTIEDQFERELYGRGMYEHRTMGSCTSAATYLTTGLRAAGIPTRMIRAVPLADASEPNQVEMVRSGIHYEPVRKILVAALEKLHNSFAGHTFNEVFVGGRWRTLNYATLGQNTFDAELMGLLTIIQRYSDFSECGVGDTWGVWLTRAPEDRSEPFLHVNPYRVLEVADHCGVHSGMTADSPRDHKQLTIVRLYWAESEQAPDFIRDARLGERYFLGHVREWFIEQDSDQLKRFTERVDLECVLRPEDAALPEVVAQAKPGCASSASGAVREILFEIPEASFAKIRPGVAYILAPRNQSSQRVERWIVDDGATLTLEMK